MSFDIFIKNLERELQHPLPGEDAQFAMAPYRKKFSVQAENYKMSAVLVLIYPFKKIPHTVLMLRNSYDGVHSRQVSFPGGSKDEYDKNLAETALREAEEEIGINKNKVQIIGKLSSVFIPPSGFLVEPYVAFMKEKPQFYPDKKEVNALIETPLDMIIAENTVKTKIIKLSNGLVVDDTPYFDIYGHTVWGATAMMLGEFKEILKKTVVA